MVTIHPVWRCQCWCGYQKPMICHGIVHGLKKMGKTHHELRMLGISRGSPRVPIEFWAIDSSSNYEVRAPW